MLILFIAFYFIVHMYYDDDSIGDYIDKRIYVCMNVYVKVEYLFFNERDELFHYENVLLV